MLSRTLRGYQPLARFWRHSATSTLSSGGVAAQLALLQGLYSSPSVGSPNASRRQSVQLQTQAQSSTQVRWVSSGDADIPMVDNQSSRRSSAGSRMEKSPKGGSGRRDGKFAPETTRYQGRSSAATDYSSPSVRSPGAASLSPDSDEIPTLKEVSRLDDTSGRRGLGSARGEVNRRTKSDSRQRNLTTPPDVFPERVDSLPEWSGLGSQSGKPKVSYDLFGPDPHKNMYNEASAPIKVTEDGIPIDGFDGTDPNIDQILQKEFGEKLREMIVDEDDDEDGVIHDEEEPSVERKPKKMARSHERKSSDKHHVHHDHRAGHDHDQVHETDVKRSTAVVPSMTVPLASLRKKITMKDPLPEHLDCCRGCGAKFQTESVDLAGYVPQTQYDKYKERIVAQLNAARHDLRVRSGGGKGIGTAVAALHASLKVTLEQVKEESKPMGTFTAERLAAIGLDEQMRPLPTTLEDAHDPVIQEALDQEAREGARRYNTWLAQKLSSEAKTKYTEALNIDDGESTSVPPPEKFSPEQKSATFKEDQSVIDARQLALLKKAAKESTKAMRCLRCHQLAHGGVAKGAVAAIRAEDFMKLLQSRFLVAGGHSCIIIKLVDIFDFHGSFIQNFHNLAGGRNPIFVVANKFDLLPSEVGVERVKAWLARECERYSLHYYGIHVVSSETGFGIEDLMRRVLKTARGENSKNAPRNRNVYVVGATNVGKSTFINALIRKGLIGTGLPADMAAPKKVAEGEDKPRATRSLDAPLIEDVDVTLAEQARGSALVADTTSASLQEISEQVDPKTADLVKSNLTAFSPLVDEKYLLKMHQEMLKTKNQATTSPIPGTTLGMVSYPILEKKRGGKALKVFDTPGVINAHQATAHLHYEELKAVLPTDSVRPLEYRIEAGQSLLIGGLVRLDFVSGRPFSVSCFFSPLVSVHVTRTSRITPEYLSQHAGTMLIPPFSRERADALMIAKTLGLSPDECLKAEIIRRQSAKLEEEFEARNREERKKRMSQQSPSDDYNDHVLPPREDVEDDDELESISPEDIREEVTRLMTQKYGKPIEEDPVRIVPVDDSSLVSLQNPARCFMDSKGRLIFQLQGAGWKTASHDIAISGLGWVAVTGAGAATFRVALAAEQPLNDALPEDIVTIDDIVGYGRLARVYRKAYVRDPLMPWNNTSVQRFHGTPAAMKMTSSSRLTAASKREGTANSKSFDLAAELEANEDSDDPIHQHDRDLASKAEFVSKQDRDNLGLTPEQLDRIKPRLVRALYRKASELRAKAKTPHDIVVAKLDLLNGFVATLTPDHKLTVTPKKLEKGGRRGRAAALVSGSNEASLSI